MRAVWFGVVAAGCARVDVSTAGSDAPVTGGLPMNLFLGGDDLELHPGIEPQLHMCPEVPRPEVVCERPSESGNEVVGPGVGERTTCAQRSDCPSASDVCWEGVCNPLTGRTITLCAYEAVLEGGAISQDDEPAYVRVHLSPAFGAEAEPLWSEPIRSCHPVWRRCAVLDFGLFLHASVVANDPDVGFSDVSQAWWLTGLVNSGCAESVKVLTLRPEAPLTVHSWLAVWYP